MGRIRFSKRGFVFFILLSIAEMHQAGVIGIWYLTAVFISLLIAFYASINYLNKCNAIRCCEKIYIEPVRILIFQWIIICGYNILLYCFGVGQISLMKSSLIQMSLPGVVLLGGWGFFYICRNNALRYLKYSIFANFLIVLIFKLFQMGISDFLSGILSVFSGMSLGNPLETNADAVFAVGLLFLYMCQQRFFEKKPLLLKVFLMMLLIFLCGKRSQYLALFVLGVFSFLTDWVSEKKLYRFEIVASIVMIGIYYGYIFLMDKGILSAFLYAQGVNGMGRLQMWDYVAQFLEFSPTFMGHGYSFSTLMLENNRIWTYKGAAYSLHGGILGFYNDMGFILFGAWMIFNLIIVPKIFRKKYGYNIMNLYWSLTIYLFILYLTESSINHFITQTTYIVILLHAISNIGYVAEKSSKELKKWKNAQNT